MDKSYLVENRTKEELRDKLFEKYFEVKDGILVLDLINKLSFIKEAWKELHILCGENIECFHFMLSLGKFRMMKHQGREYLILKLGLWEYVIIDLEKKENISEMDFHTLFDEDFFVEHFDERKEEDKSIFETLYMTSEYNGDIDELKSLYLKYQDIFELSTCISYQYHIGDSYTYFSIDFENAIAHLGFQAPNQFLYENLNFNYDLTPWCMQDAHRSMGLDKMMELFKRTREICIPKEVIPGDLYKQYVSACHKENYQFQKRK